MIGVYKLYDIAGALTNVYAVLLWLVGLSASKLLCSVIFNNVEDKGILLVLTFVYSISESALISVLYFKVLNGFETVGIHFNGKSPFIKFAELKTITVIFAMIRGFLTLLPELVYLSTSEYEGIINSYDR